MTTYSVILVILSVNNLNFYNDRNQYISSKTKFMASNQ
jgi:hypothetical protein